jgi:penicillin-binding protein 1A
MAAAYGAFANGGFRVTPTLIDSVQDRRGRVIWRADQRACAACASGPEAGPPRLEAGEKPRATDPISAYQMVSILEGVVQRGTAAGTIGSRLGRPVAGKTGTTDDYKDNWFVGFTPDIVVQFGLALMIRAALAITKPAAAMPRRFSAIPSPQPWPAARPCPSAAHPALR